MYGAVCCAGPTLRVASQQHVGRRLRWHALDDPHGRPVFARRMPWCTLDRWGEGGCRSRVPVGARRSSISGRFGVRILFQIRPCAHRVSGMRLQGHHIQEARDSRFVVARDIATSRPDVRTRAMPGIRLRSVSVRLRSRCPCDPAVRGDGLRDPEKPTIPLVRVEARLPHQE